ncbi:MAG: PEP-CTERM sorting domain-containing protein, partial [Planctomycetota bacterium]
ITYSDTEFATTDWTQTEIADSSLGGTVVVSQVSPGGNPGAYYDGTHLFTGPGRVDYGHLYAPAGGAVVDPSLGAINTIDFALDAAVFFGSTSASGPGVNPGVRWYWLLEQAGVYYGAGDLVAIKADDCKSLSQSGLTASDFYVIDRAGGGLTPGSPDFSTGGDSISFGFATANSNPGGPVNVVVNWGVDNWSVTVNTESTGGGTDPVPEPGTFALFGVALVAYGAYRRRRTSP